MDILRGKPAVGGDGVEAAATARARVSLLSHGQRAAGPPGVRCVVQPHASIRRAGVARRGSDPRSQREHLARFRQLADGSEEHKRGQRSSDGNRGRPRVVGSCLCRARRRLSLAHWALLLLCVLHAGRYVLGYVQRATCTCGTLAHILHITIYYAAQVGLPQLPRHLAGLPGRQVEEAVRPRYHGSWHLISDTYMYS